MSASNPIAAKCLLLEDIYKHMNLFILENYHLSVLTVLKHILELGVSKSTFVLTKVSNRLSVKFATNGSLSVVT